MNLRFALASAILASGVGVAAIAAMQIAPAPDERREVAGWLVEDVIERRDTEQVRVIRMTRSVGGETLSYEISPGYGWPGNYEVSGNGGTCLQNVDFLPESAPTPAGRGPSIRAAFTRVMPQFEQFCGLPPGTGARLLDGFDPAFAVLASWYDRRMADCQAEALGNGTGMDCPLASSSNAASAIEPEMNAM